VYVVSFKSFLQPKGAQRLSSCTPGRVHLLHVLHRLSPERPWPTLTAPGMAPLQTPVGWVQWVHRRISPWPCCLRNRRRSPGP